MVGRKDSNLLTSDEGHRSDASMLAFIQEKHKWNASRFNNLQPDLAVTRINQTDFLCGGT